MKKSHVVRGAGCLAVVLGAGLSNADVIDASSSGYGISAELSLLILGLDVHPQAFVGGAAPGPYAQSTSVVNASFSTAALASLQAGVLSGAASSDVDGGAGSRGAVGHGEVVGLNVGVVLGTILSLSAAVIESDASITGDYGALNGIGSSVLTDVNLSVLGASIAVDASAAPNTVIFDTLGIRVVLNEQIHSGNGIDHRSVEVNAIRITFDDVVAGLGLLNGDIRIAHAAAEMGAIVPAPSAAAMAAIGGLLATRRRR